MWDNIDVAVVGVIDTNAAVLLDDFELVRAVALQRLEQCTDVLLWSGLPSVDDAEREQKVRVELVVLAGHRLDDGPVGPGSLLFHALDEGTEVVVGSQTAHDGLDVVIQLIEPGLIEIDCAGEQGVEVAEQLHLISNAG